MKMYIAAFAALLVVAAGCAKAGSTATATTSSATSQTMVQTTQPAQAAAGDGPPTQNGVYIVNGICFGEGGCPWKHWRSSEPTPVYQASDASSPVMANVAPGAWVETIEGQLRFVPRRGVVLTADQGLEVGDVIYLLESSGEGDFTIWRHGKSMDWHWPDDFDQNPTVRWDAPAPDTPTSGWWVHVKLADGRTGWLHEPRFECMGPIAGDEGCRG